MRYVRDFRIAAGLLFAVSAAWGAGFDSVGAAFAASAEKGKAAFVQHGCWQCHGFNGQSTVTSNGKVLARTALPLDAFKSFVRNSNGAMPPYRPAVLSDADLDDIYAYLQSLPQPKAASDIPLLGGVRSH
jgi:ubiquinol-cytochrome c reductase cytochrome c subunit